ncbi:MAG: leucyl/phenylalanyl-tRNA--protein transferase [Thermodesulfovibrionales bacterium]|nr:leucyl/phenylalanyl-tRNA--protein transferase [Thermodesulfovibrionales bacterium]
MAVFQLTNAIAFPSPYLADEDGLLAVGGDLSVERLLLAYKMGIFPWYSEDSPILWWSPDPRLILIPSEFKVSRSLRTVIKKNIFVVTFDTAFDDVITMCAKVRASKGQSTWITNEMISAYNRLHKEGFAHSVECWQDGQLVGGLYGVSIGKAFFGESMFSICSNSSKVALHGLVERLKQWSFDFIDCQTVTSHLISLGARLVSKEIFMDMLSHAIKHPTRFGKW